MDRSQHSCWKWGVVYPICEQVIFRIRSSGMLRCVALVRTDVSEERITSMIRVTRISELGTTLAVTCCEELLCENGSVNMEYQIKDAERSGG
jgi:hypothetical protein